MGEPMKKAASRAAFSQISGSSLKASRLIGSRHFGALGLCIQSPLKGLVNLTPMNRNITGRLDTQSHLVTANLNHGDHDAIIDHNAFILLS